MDRTSIRTSRHIKEEDVHTTVDHPDPVMTTIDHRDVKVAIEMLTESLRGIRILTRLVRDNIETTIEIEDVTSIPRLLMLEELEAEVLRGNGESGCSTENGKCIAGSRMVRLILSRFLMLLSEAVAKSAKRVVTEDAEFTTSMRTLTLVLIGHEVRTLIQSAGRTTKCESVQSNEGGRQTANVHLLPLMLMPGQHILRV